MIYQLSEIEIKNYIVLIVESIILCFIFAFVIMLYNKNKRKKQKTTYNLLGVYLFYGLAYIFIIISRATYYSLNVESMDQYSIVGWLLFRIGYYRITFIFILFATYFCYMLFIQVFKAGESGLEKKILLLFAFLISIYSLLVFDFASPILDVICFSMIFLYVNYVYIKFFKNAIILQKRTTERRMKKAIQSLALMSISFIFMFLFYLVDRIWILFTGQYFSVFYYMALLCVSISVLAAYLGYVKPEKK